jgi:regulator of protease activity HflC (stomatin/prohibitin superfamily)
MNTRLTALIQALQSAWRRRFSASKATATELHGDFVTADDATHTVFHPLPEDDTEEGQGFLRRNAVVLVALASTAAAAYLVATHLPLQNVERGDVGIRTNQFTGSSEQFSSGTVVVLPGLHSLRALPLRDQTYRPSSGAGDASYQSVEGLSLGVDITVRWALSPDQLKRLAKDLPDDVAGEVVQPAVQGVVYKIFSRYTVREIFSSKRADIQKTIETDLLPRLAAEGIVLRSVQIGKVTLPEDYKRGMDKLLAEELEAEKMRYTLDLKGKKVKESELDAEADKVRREKAAEAAAREQVIAARAQEDAMKHVLPFKQKQIEQRQFEAEAEKVARIKTAEGSAQSRRIEAQGEADSRQKLADAEVYRLEKVGKVNSEQMAREGALISRHPLLIQKTLADKLSDKIQVIIAPPPADGGFIGAGLVGALKNNPGNAAADAANTDTNPAQVQ